MFILLEYMDNLMDGENGHISVGLFEEQDEAKATMDALSFKGFPLVLYEARPVLDEHDDAAVKKARLEEEVRERVERFLDDQEEAQAGRPTDAAPWW